MKKERHEGITDITRIMLPAIWGAKKNGELDGTQKRIHKQCIPVIKTLFDSPRLKDLSAPRRFAIEFLIRELMYY